MTAALLEREHAFSVFHLCAGIGFGALGFQRGHARVGRATARFRTLGAIDVDAVACEDFRRIVRAPCTELDLFSVEQYTAFHGRLPPEGWREATAQDIRAAAGGEFPDVVFWSPPCKGLSSLLNSRSAASARYQALNELVVRALDLALEAFGDDPPPLFLLENVPRIQTRGRDLLDRVKLRLELAGYACAETVHDCGELGGLAQHRQRFLLVARHRQKIRPFLYEPDRKPVRGVGEVVGQLPMPDDPRGGPMHRMPRLQWRTWVRLALIRAGSDWRSLNDLEVDDSGHVRGLRIAPGDRSWHAGVMGVRPWDEPAGAVCGRSSSTNGEFAVADPRPPREIGSYEPYGVVGWDEVGRTVTGQAAPGAGPYSVADPRPVGMGEHSGKMRVEAWDGPAHTITGSDRVGSGAMSVADPRAGAGWDGKGKYVTTAWDQPVGAVIAGSSTGQGALTVADPREPTRFNNVYRVVRWDESAGAITCGATPSAGGQSVADPRVGSKSEAGEFVSARHYGVLQWDETSPAVTGSACHDNGAHSVADPRPPEPHEKCNPWIWSLDGMRHRPFTTLDLIALQGFPLETILDLVLGGTDSNRREHVGNGVPIPTAQAIASTMLSTLLLARLGQTFTLSATPIWVDRPVALLLGAELPEVCA